MAEHGGLHVRLRQAGPIPLAVEFSCQQGELFALIGLSGSGKTTTLRSIAGLYRPRDGLVRCNGGVWLDTNHGIDLPPHRRPVGLVFQSYALFPHMTALGNVAAALGHRPVGERLARAREVLAREPAVLLLDEPFSAVDRPTRRKLHAELAELRQSVRIPIVLVTHDIDEAAALADRLCVIDHGETLQAGRPAELLAAPASPRVAMALDLPEAEQVG